MLPYALGLISMAFPRFARVFQLSRFFRELEQELETVVKVLRPGPLGVNEHKFSAQEIQDANTTVRRAVETWRMNAAVECRYGIIRDYIRN